MEEEGVLRMFVQGCRESQSMQVVLLHVGILHMEIGQRHHVRQTTLAFVSTKHEILQGQSARVERVVHVTIQEQAKNEAQKNGHELGTIEQTI